MPEHHDMAPADRPASVIPDDNRHAVLVRTERLPLIRALLHPFVEIIREPGGKLRYVLETDEIVPLAAHRILLHLALRLQADFLEVYDQNCMLHDKSPLY